MGMFFDNLSKIRLASTVMVRLPALCRIYAGILIVPLSVSVFDIDRLCVMMRKYNQAKIAKLEKQVERLAYKIKRQKNKVKTGQKKFKNYFV